MKVYEQDISTSSSHMVLKLGTGSVHHRKKGFQEFQQFQISFHVFLLEIYKNLKRRGTRNLRGKGENFGKLRT